MLVSKDALHEIIQNTWNSTLGFQVELADSARFLAEGAFTVCVEITGSWEGEVRLQCPAQLARSIAAVIFAREADHVESSDILDALSELIHIIGGNLKALLAPPVDLSLPTLPGPTQGAKIPPSGEMVHRLALLCQGQPLIVTLWRYLPEAGRLRAHPEDDNQLRPENP